MIQVRKIITLAASRLGVINYGENLDAKSSQTILDILQMLFDEMSIRTINYKHYEETFTGKTPLIIGIDRINSVSGDILERPAMIESVIYSQGNINYPLTIHPYPEFRELSLNNISSIPNAAYIDYDEPFIRIFTFPNAVAGTLRVIGRSYLTSYNLTVNDYIDLPREYHLGIMSNLALKIAGFFGTPIDQSLIIEASAGLKHIKQRQLMQNRKQLKNDLTHSQSPTVYMGF